MADNGYGIEMKKDVKIEIEIDENSRIKSYKTPFPDIKYTKLYPLAFIGYPFVGLTAFITAAAVDRSTISPMLTVYKHHTNKVPKSVSNMGLRSYHLANSQREFIYMDVGRWGGEIGKEGHRDFCIVCGPHVVLCKFNTKKTNTKLLKNKDTASKNINNLIKQLIGNEYSIKITATESIYSIYRDPKIIYIIIGDMHLPITTKKMHPVSQSRFRYMSDLEKLNFYSTYKEDCMGRVMDGTLERINSDDIRWLNKWYDNYYRGDIFENGDEDLIKFLKQIEIARKELNKSIKKEKEKLNIHFIQVGDLYDLWIGLDRFYEEDIQDKGPPGKVELRKDSKKEAKKNIKYWIDNTKKCFPELTTLLEGLDVNEKTFLYGNHDNYLGVYHPGLNERKRFFRKNGLYIEHGHWIDSSNYDGNKGMTGGHKITNWVFEISELRKFDPDRRHFYTLNAAIEYFKKPFYDIFIMGHTHMPYLTKVKIDLKFSPSLIWAIKNKIDNSLYEFNKGLQGIIYRRRW